MYQSERLEKILKILEENGYTTVKYLTDELHYSNATVNRDLALLEAKKLVKRSYGGVELEEKKGVPLVFRYHKMKSSKMKIARTAAELIEDGDTVFIDATTTTQYMGHFLADKKDITVITNNMALATYLADVGKSVICLGGEIVEAQITCQSCSAFESQTIALKASFPALFFIFQALYTIIEFFRVKRALKKYHGMLEVHLAYETFCLCRTQRIFTFRINVGVVIIEGYSEKLRKIFKTVAAARCAAGVKQ